MARVIEELVVGIRADAGGMQAGLAKASTQTKSFGASIAKLARPIAAAFAVTRVVSFASAVMNAADESAKQARAIGASLEGMIGLQHAAGLAGVEFADITKNAQMLQKRLGEGEGTTAEALKMLGKDANALKAMRADQTIIEVVEALGAVKNPAERANAAMQLFGRGGLKMLQMVELGKDGIRAMAKEAEELGLTLNMGEALQLEEINDNFTRMKSAIKGVAQTFLIEMAPAIMSTTEKLVEFGKYINGIFSRGAEQEITALGAAFKVWQDAISGGIEGGARAAGFSSFADNMRDIAEGEKELAAAAKLAQEGPMFGPLIEAMKQFEEAQSMRGAELTEKFFPEDFASQRAELNKLLEGGFIDQTVFDAALKDLEARDPVAKWFQKMLDAGEAALEKQKGLADALTDSLLTPWERAQKEMGAAQEMAGRGLISEDTYARAIAKGMEDSPMAQMEKERAAWMEQLMNQVPKEAARSIDALSGGDIVGQVRRGQLGGAMDLQQEQLNTQKRLEKWLAVIAGGGVTPAFSWGR
jgi:hypothetical protein